MCVKVPSIWDAHGGHLVCNLLLRLSSSFTLLAQGRDAILVSSVYLYLSIPQGSQGSVPLWILFDYVSFNLHHTIIIVASKMLNFSIYIHKKITRPRDIKWFVSHSINGKAMFNTQVLSVTQFTKILLFWSTTMNKTRISLLSLKYMYTLLCNSLIDFILLKYQNTSYPGKLIWYFYFLLEKIRNIWSAILQISYSWFLE